MTYDSQIDISDEKKLDDLGNEFEEAWLAGQSPDIVQYLSRIEDRLENRLLRDLLRIELDYRLRGGESPKIPEYQQRFPGNTALIADVLREASNVVPPNQDQSASSVQSGEKTRTISYRPILPQAQPGRYIRTGFHDRGGMGEVWNCQDTDIGREVAFKTLRKFDEKHRHRFFAEAQVTGQLEHPGIVPVYDLGIDEEGQPFYVMKFVHGRTLKKAIEEYHSLEGSERRILHYKLLESFESVCQSIAYAHSRGVLHRDLKPDNIMVGEFGETVVLDWGLAKVRGQSDAPISGSHSSYVRLTHTSDSASETQYGDVMGAPPYMPPEVAESRWDDVKEATDIYLLGATLYQILTGQPPRRGSSVDEMRDMAATVVPPDPRHLKRDIPKPLEAICLKAMAFDKDRRYGSATELAEDIQRFLAGDPVSVYRENLSERLWRWSSKHRIAIGRSLAAAIVLSVGVFGFMEVRESRLKAAAAIKSLELKELRDSAVAAMDLFSENNNKLHYWAASSDPDTEDAPYYDLERGNELARIALAAIEPWGPTLEKLPLDESEIEIARQELSDFLLLTVQLKLRMGVPGENRDDLLAMLDRAASLQEPSRGYYTLRAEVLEAIGKIAESKESLESAKTARLTAMDHFLRGNMLRTGATGSVAGHTVEGDQDIEDHMVTVWKNNGNRLLLAKKEFQSVLRTDADHYWSRFQLASCYMGLGKYNEAIETLSGCIALEPNQPWAYSAQAIAFAVQGEFEEANQALDRADVDFAPGQLNRGVVLWMEGRKTRNKAKTDLALKQFNKVLEMTEGKLVEAAFYRAQIWATRKNGVAQALADLEMVIEQRPSFRAAFLLRAQILLSRNSGEDITQVMEDLDSYLNLDDAALEWEIHYHRGALLRRLGSRPVNKRVLELAQKELELSEARGADSPDVFVDLAAVHHKLHILQSTDQAKRHHLEIEIAACTQGLEFEPDHFGLLNMRAHAYEAKPLEDGDKAMVDYTRLVNMKPKNALDQRNQIDAHSGRGYAFAMAGDEKQALASATKASLLLEQHRPNDFILRHNLACVYAKLHEHTGQNQDAALVILHSVATEAKKQGFGKWYANEIDRESAFDSIRKTKALQEVLAFLRK